MKKKIAAALLGAMMVCGNAFAMQFEQPEEIGWFGISQAGKGGGGFVCKQASRNDGNFYTKYRPNNKKSFEKGIAQFGDGTNALYVHYNVNDKKNKILVGGKNKENTISGAGITETVSKIQTDEGITLYALCSYYGSERDYLIAGYRKDAKFVKYIDTYAMTRNYFEWGKHGASPVLYTNLSCEGNTLIITYRRHGNREDEGEFRFKWDEAAQWFGVEQVVY